MEYLVTDLAALAYAHPVTSLLALTLVCGTVCVTALLRHRPDVVDLAFTHREFAGGMLTLLCGTLLLVLLGTGIFLAGRPAHPGTAGPGPAAPVAVAPGGGR